MLKKRTALVAANVKLRANLRAKHHARLPTKTASKRTLCKVLRFATSPSTAKLEELYAKARKK
jgi:hypothetical protein